MGLYNYKEFSDHYERALRGTQYENVKLEKRPLKQISKVGATYEGQWIVGKDTRQGKGVLVWPDGSRYEGFWIDNQAWGHGRLIHADKDVYVGQWHKDKAHGKGKYHHADGSVYEGDWDQDKQTGFGKETFPGGSIFEGQYVNGKKEGKGHFNW